MRRGISEAMDRIRDALADAWDAVVDWRWWIASFLLVAIVAGLFIWPRVTVMLTWLKHMELGEADRLRLVAVMPSDAGEDQFLRGVRLAIDEVNDRGGVRHQPLSLELFQEPPIHPGLTLESVVSDAISLAGQVVTRPDLMAVVGHGSSITSVAASGVYGRTGQLYLATHATSTSLTNHGFDTVFSLQPNNQDLASVLARHALKENYRRVVILADDSEYSTEITGMFRSLLTAGGGRELYRGLLSSNVRSIDSLILFILNNAVFSTREIDAFFIASSSMDATARFIRRARELGLDMPIIGPDYLFSRTMLEKAGKAGMKGVAAASLFDIDSREAEARLFDAAFRTAYDDGPDQMAAIGYDAVKVLAYASEVSETGKPADMADRLRTMRHTGPLHGATGWIAFDATGLITDTDLYVVHFDGEAFHTVDTYRKPLDWSGTPFLGDALQPTRATKELLR